MLYNHITSIQIKKKNITSIPEKCTCTRMHAHTLKRGINLWHKSLGNFHLIWNFILTSSWNILSCSLQPCCSSISMAFFITAAISVIWSTWACNSWKKEMGVAKISEILFFFFNFLDCLLFIKPVLTLNMNVIFLHCI